VSAVEENQTIRSARIQKTIIFTSSKNIEDVKKKMKQKRAVD
jgi:hypothetical protein